MSGEYKHNEKPTLKDYEQALELLDQILVLLEQLDGPLDMESKRSDFENNQKEIKELVLKLFRSNLPLKEGNIATLQKEIITTGSRGGRYKHKWAIVGPIKKNPFKLQNDGSEGIGENSLFSVNSENPEDITQNMPTEMADKRGNHNDGGRFRSYYEIVEHVIDEVKKFMEEETRDGFLGGRRKTRKKRKKRKTRKKRKKRKTRRKSKKRRRKRMKRKSKKKL